MSVHVKWADPSQHIIHLEFQRGWSWGDVRTAIQRADDLIVSVPHTVHLMIDIRKAGGLPRDFMTAAGELFSQGDARPNEGKRVVVGAGPFIRMAYNGLASVYGHKLGARPFLFADNTEQAHALLRR
jgi:hypothetical protein